MQKFKAILFDMDGVIVDSELYWNKVEKEFAKMYGIKYGVEYRRKIMARSAINIAEIFINDFGVKASIKKIIADRNKLAIDIYKTKAKLLPGFLSLIEKIKKNNYKTALVSSSSMLWINLILKRYKLNKYFDHIISADELSDGNGKPNPEIYLLAAKEVSISPRECLVFEDSVNGVKSAKAAGMYCVAVPNTRWVKDTRGIGLANIVVKTLKDKRIEKILNLK